MGCFNNYTCLTCRVASVRENKITCGDLSHRDKNSNIEFTERDIDLFQNKWVTWIRLYNIKTNSEYNLEKSDYTNYATLESGARRLIKQILQDTGSKENYKELCKKIANVQEIDETFLPVNLINEVVNVEAIKKAVLEASKKELDSIKNQFERYCASAYEIEDRITDKACDILNRDFDKRVNLMINTIVEKFLSSEQGVKFMEGKITKVKTETIIKNLPDNVISLATNHAIDYINPQLIEVKETINTMKDEFYKKMQIIEPHIEDIAKKAVQEAFLNNLTTRDEQVTKLQNTVDKLISRIEQLQKQINEYRYNDRNYVSFEEVSKMVENAKDKDTSTKLEKFISVYMESNKVIEEMFKVKKGD